MMILVLLHALALARRLIVLPFSFFASLLVPVPVSVSVYLGPKAITGIHLGQVDQIDHDRSDRS